MPEQTCDETSQNEPRTFLREAENAALFLIWGVLVIIGDEVILQLIIKKSTYTHEYMLGVVYSVVVFVPLFVLGKKLIATGLRRFGTAIVNETVKHLKEDE